MFIRGEIVNVTIKGVRYHVFDESAGEHEIETPTGARYQLPATATLERVAPKEWPPRPNDVWADGDGGEWFTFAARAADGITLRPAVDMAFWATPDDLLTNHGPVRLVRRRDWSPEPAAVEQEQVPPPAADRRATRIAGLRAFADMLTERPDVPPPFSVNGQIGFKGQDQLAEAERLATSFGVELGRPYDTGHAEQRWARSAKVDFGGEVALTLYVHGLDAPEPAEAGDSEATS